MSSYRRAVTHLAVLALCAALVEPTWALPTGTAIDADAANDRSGRVVATVKLANVVFGPATVLQAACGRVQSTGTFSVQGTTNDGGGLDQGAVTVFDDGVLIASANFAVPVGTTVTFAYDLTVAHTIGVPGVAISVRESAGDPTAINFISPTESPTAACPALQQVVVPASFGESIPVPALAPAALVLLLAALGALGMRSLRRRG